MMIANPIYDAVFKYLMDDQRAAKLILSALTDLEIEELQLRHPEIRTDKGVFRGYNVFRRVFAARARTPAGPKLIQIEILKAKFPTDIIHYRKYLGTPYARAEREQKISNPATMQSPKETEATFGIYFLGRRLEHATAPVIRVAQEIVDVATGVVFPRRDEFIESLTHDGVIIQTPELRERRRTKLEQLLAVFDPILAEFDNPHFLRFNEKNFPEEFRDVIETLMMAHCQEDLSQAMVIEDQILAEFRWRERELAEDWEIAANARLRGEKERQFHEEERRLNLAAYRKMKNI